MPFAHFRRLFSDFLFGLLLALASPEAFAGPAVYEVTAQGSDLVLKIDTHPWQVGIYARTVVLTVSYNISPDGRTEVRHYDFLKDASTPKYLEAGHVYQRTIKSEIAGEHSLAATNLAIASTSLGFKDESGKGDFASIQTKQGSPGPVDTVVQPAHSVVVGPPSPMFSIETNINRQGMDYRRMEATSSQACAEMCRQDPQCRAFTIVKGGNSPGGTCWLKNRVPQPSECGNCTSGVKTTSVSIEANTNRQGMDYHRMETPSSQACAEMCRQDPQCRAFTIVKGDNSPAGTCWLKNRVPQPSGCGNCTSGVKEL